MVNQKVLISRIVDLKGRFNNVVMCYPLYGKLVKLSFIFLLQFSSYDENDILSMFKIIRVNLNIINKT